MKRISYKMAIRFSAFFLTVVLLLGSVCNVYAIENIDNLKEQTSELNNELSGLNQELDLLEEELNDMLSAITETSSQLESTQQELATALGKEIAQRDAMTLRIQSMYENGNFNVWVSLLSSVSIADFVNRAEYIIQVNNYDRKLLKEYSQTCEQIEAQQNELEEATKYLNSLQNDLTRKEQILKTKISNTSSDLSKYSAKLEEAQEAANRAEQEAQKPIDPIIPPTPNPPTSNSGSSSGDGNISYSASDVELLAALLECEAGSSNYQAVLAVASVVVNRMKHRSFPNTVRGVIYHPGQFPPAHDGKVDRILKRGVNSLCVKAATDALNGANNVGSCLYFRASSSGYSGTIIGDNVFF